MLRHFFNRDENASLDLEIAAIYAEMDKIQDKTSETYSNLVAQLDRLIKIKTEGRRDRVKRDTWAIIIGGAAQILLIIIYEQKHVMTSRAYTHIIKPK